MLRWEDWLTQAGDDQAAAADLLATKHWAWSCFACHQAAEKYLKAVLEVRRLPHEGHSLPALLNKLHDSLQQELPDGVYDACRALNRLYIPTRYPDAHQEGAPVDNYGERDARNAIRDLETLVEFLAPLVRPPKV